MHSTTTSLGLALLRLVAGGFLLPHGLGKLFGWFGGPGVGGFAAELVHFGLPSAEPAPLVLAAVQTGIGALIAIGLFTRAAAVLGAAFLATTILLALPAGWFWMHRGAEFPVFWTVALLVVALLGPGAWSIDALRAQGRR